jgi:phosphoribosylformylglycinamidine (FGAM) synthase PurS component
MYAVPASALQRIELLDGTVLQGEILSFDGAAYAVRTENLGTMRIDKSKVRSIRMGTSASGTQQEVQDLLSRMLMNPDALGMIMGLQNDPDVQAVLNDPEIMSAAEAGDFGKLLSNPKFIKLLQNPVIQEIGKGLSR